MAGRPQRFALPGAAHPEWLRPDLGLPRVGALMSTRAGGISQGEFAGLNLGTSVGDNPAHVAENRRRFGAALGGAPVWLRQVHGAGVVRLGEAELASVRGAAAPIEADASLTTIGGIACIVQVADCLPVLFAAPQQRGVAAAHAGWRGLAAGVLEATVQALSQASGCEPRELSAWLGPCIGPSRFEVGAEVVEAFGGGARFSALGDGKFLADLAGLAADRLVALGLQRLRVDGSCTVEEASRFFSFRRDHAALGSTGRMAAAIWIDRRQDGG